MKTSMNRMKKDLETLATYNETPGNGVTRSSYTKEDRQAREYLINEMKKIGLEIYEDGYATLFGKRKGNMQDAPSIMIGSHYDTVYQAGAFDGTAGSVAALEVMRVLEEEHFDNDYPIELILMNAEEGATFGPSTGVSNSRAMMGTMTEGELDSVRNRFGQTKREAMKAYGIEVNLEKAKRDSKTIKNFIELHVEQGPILEQENIEIGLVSYLAGIGRYTIRFYGEDGDSTAIMSERKDALVAAASFIQNFDKKIKELGEDITGMVGKLDIQPNSNQFVPSYVEGKIEIRTFTKEAATRCDYKQIIEDLLHACHTAYGVRTELEEIRRIGYPNPTGPAIMNPENIEKMEKICDDLGYSHIRMNKGTGHDSMIMADYVDTNMIYVPSRNGGVSHCPQEWTDYEDIQKGADVLLNLVKELSKK